MEAEMIKHLELIAAQLTAEAKEKAEWGHFGNPFGRSESRKLLEFCAEVLLSIAANI